MRVRQFKDGLFELFERPVGADNRLSSIFKSKRDVADLAEDYESRGHRTKVVKCRGGWQLYVE